MIERPWSVALDGAIEFRRRNLQLLRELDSPLIFGDDLPTARKVARNVGRGVERYFAAGLVTPVWVSPEMTTLVEHFAAELPESEPFYPSDLEPLAGFAAFSRPLIPPEPLDPEHPLAERITLAEQLEALTPGGPGVFLLWMPAGTEHDPYEARGVNVYAYSEPSPKSPSTFATSALLFGEPATTPTMRAFLALLRLMWQKIGLAERREPDRATARRAAKTLDEIPTILVVDLRQRFTRTNDDESGGTSPEWSHRWIVNGHVHHYWCGPARDELKALWVANYVKGPPEKPLVFKTRILNVVR